MKNVELGDRVKCKITGFKGIVEAITNWVNGCSRAGVRSEKLSEKGGQLDLEWIDCSQLKVLKNKAYSWKKKAKKPAGPKNDPQRRIGG